VVNYYTLLKIPQNAVEITIRDAIKKERRRWSQRASHPKQEIRTEAEQRVREIAEAESILLDPNKRMQYNQALETNPSSSNSSNVPMPSNEKDWLEVTKYYYKMNNLNSASYAAREAVKQEFNNSEAWYWKALISAGLQIYTDAEFELNEAVRLNPSNSDYQFELGLLYSDNGMHQKALTQFIKVQNMDKSFFKPDDFLHLRILCLWGMNNFRIACPVIIEYYNRCGGNPKVANLFAGFIYDMIFDSWSKMRDNSFIITNMNQYRFTKHWQKILNKISVHDNILRKDIADINRTIARFEQVSHSSSAGDVGNTFLNHGLFGALGHVAGNAARGSKMAWEWNVPHLTPDVLQTGMQ